MSEKITVNFTPEVRANMRKNGINRGKSRNHREHCTWRDGSSTSHCLVVTREQKFWGTGRMAAGSSLLQSSWPDLCSGSVQCAYTHFKPLETCIEQHPDYHWHDGVKRFSSVLLETELSPWPDSPRSTAGMRIPGILGPIGLLNLFAIPGWCCFLETSDGPWPREGQALFCASLRLLGI